MDFSVKHDQNVADYDFDIPEKSKRWYPMRIAFGRAERAMGIKAFLDEHKVENYLPMTRKPVDKKKNGPTRASDGKQQELVPAINSLIFVRTSEARLTDLKRFCEKLLPLRYIIWRTPVAGTLDRILTVSDREMQNFMRVSSVQDERVMWLGNKDFSQKIGRRVRVKDGVFKGVEGTVCRVKKDRRVVVSIEGVVSVALSWINPDLLEDVEERRDEDADTEQRNPTV